MANESSIEFTRSALNSAEIMVRWAVVLNGAAAAGLLTFIGGAIDKQNNFHSWGLLGTSILLFAAGIGTALICSFAKLIALNYMAQVHDPSANASKEEIEIYLLVGDRAAIWGIACLVALFTALVLFVVGIYVGKLAIFG